MSKSSSSRRSTSPPPSRWLALLVAALQLLCLFELATFTGADESGLCEQLQAGTASLLAMGKVQEHFYLIGADFRGLRLPADPIHTHLDLSSAEEVGSLLSASKLPKEGGGGYTAGKSTGFLFLDDGRRAGEAIPTMSSPSLAVLSEEKSSLAILPLDGEKEAKTAKVTPAQVATAVFLSVDSDSSSSSSHEPPESHFAVYEPATGLLTFSDVGFLLLYGERNDNSTKIGPAVQLPSGLAITGGYYVAAEKLAILFEADGIALFTGDKMEPKKVPFKDFFHCKVSSGEEDTGISSTIGGMAGVALLLLVAVCGLCVWKANKFAKKSLKTRKTRGSTSTGNTSEKANSSLNKVKGTPSLESSATGKKSSKVGSAISSSASSATGGGGGGGSTLSAVGSKNATSKTSAISSAVGGGSTLSTSPFSSKAGSSAVGGGGGGSAISAVSSAAGGGSTSKAPATSSKVDSSAVSSSAGSSAPSKAYSAVSSSTAGSKV